MATLTPAERQLLDDPQSRALIELAEQEMARRDFATFLRFITIRSDDPRRPAPSRMQPYAYQLERARAWQGGESEIVVKARQLGFSSGLLAPYALWRAMYHGWNVGYWSLGERAVKRHVDTRLVYQHARLPDGLRMRMNRVGNDLYFPESDGSIQGFPATQVAGTGDTFQLVVFDEAAFHRYFEDNWSQVQPTISAGGQAIVNSTANPKLGPSGPFYEMWRAAESGDTDVRPVFVPWSARPGRDEAWLERQRRLHLGHPEAFDAQYPATAASAFVGRTGLVYPMFAVERHVRDTHPVPWEQCLYRYAGYDLGGGDPTAIVYLGYYRSSGLLKVHQYGESVWRDGAPSSEQMYAALWEWHARGKLASIEADSVPGGQTVAADIRMLFNGDVRVRVETQGRAEGLGLVASALDGDELTIHASCTQSIREFAGYRWLERTDPNSMERYATRTPVDNHADAMDARRRAHWAAHRDLMGKRMRESAPAYSGVII